MDRRHFLRVSALSPLAAMAATANPAFAARHEAGPSAHHTFGFAADGSAFLLDGRPFQIRSGEMHPARIPVEYWRHRIRMAKAMGMNTISLYVMWNYIEETAGVFDFETDRRDIVGFLRLCQDEGMWVLLRPGPYVCGEWDLGGIPPYLLRYPDIQLRVNAAADPHYMPAVARYVGQLAARIRPLLVANGGPVLMIQIENEYGSYGSDSTYPDELRRLWLDNGVEGPFYTEDGLSQLESNHTNVPGGAIALSGGDAPSIQAARAAYPSVPAMAGEVYPGWLSHWGDSGLQTGSDVSSVIKGCMTAGYSFNLYVIHGGTSFGLYAGANANNDSSDYQPDITSYDYAAPITEQGAVGPNYQTYRDLIAGFLTQPLPAVPAPIPTTTLDGSSTTPRPFASIWDNLPDSLPTSTRPAPFETYGQSQGFVLYRRPLPDYDNGTLAITSVHDYATVFLNGRYVGGFSRPLIPANVAGALNVTNAGAPLPLEPASSVGANPVLDILVEGMGHTNYGHALVDRKGILESVSLTDAGPLSGELTGWNTYLLPMDEGFVAELSPRISARDRPGLFFRATFELGSPADTYVDMTQWTKGLLWVNGRCLGRYWEIGPQHRLYCPAPWLRPGENEIIVFDLHQTEAKPISFARELG